jgi:hypothetical protein
VSWHYSIEALAVAPALSTRNRMLPLSLLQVRTLLPWVMTSNQARHECHELIQLPTIIKVRLLGTRRQSGTVPGTVPIWPGTGTLPTLPRPRPRFVRNRGLSPVPVPDLAGTGTQPGRSPVPDSHRGGPPRPVSDNDTAGNRGRGGDLAAGLASSLSLCQRTRPRAAVTPRARASRCLTPAFERLGRVGNGHGPRSTSSWIGRNSRGRSSS